MQKRTHLLLAMLLGCHGPRLSADDGDATDAADDTSSESGGFMPALECVEPDPIPSDFDVVVTAETWPTTTDEVTRMSEQRIETSCTLVDATNTDWTLACADEDGVAHEILVDFDVGFHVPGLPATMDIHYIRDTWHDVTQFGQAEWLAARDPDSGELVAASFHGVAEFLPIVPPEAPELFAPYEFAIVWDECAPGEAALEARVAGEDERVLLPAGSVVVLGGADVWVNMLDRTSQGPESPSIHEYAFFLR